MTNDIFVDRWHICGYSIATREFVVNRLLHDGAGGVARLSAAGCRLCALLLQSSVMEAVGLNSQTEGQFQSSTCCYPSSIIILAVRVFVADILGWRAFI